VTAGSLRSHLPYSRRDAFALFGPGAPVRPDADAPRNQANHSKDTLTETRLKIAVFIDFDNIEIGVKTTLGQTFDMAAILEALKERGEVVTKVAYGDWKRAGDHGRLLSQHAIRMVQRNLTPGGDKNGADINLALDALEMAFTHDHINAFVIVGGDSDFITLVEKLKQYDKKVFVVGGRQFTSLVMQKNCHEFIAYENLVGGRRTSTTEKKGGPAPAPPSSSEVAKAFPLVKRALKVLVDREVSPQLGLLKSTLLQLDSTFSERDYGASTFRDFIEKVAQTGMVTLRHSGRSLLVELPETNGGSAEGAASPAAHSPVAEPTPPEAPIDTPREAANGAADADPTAQPEAREPVAAVPPVDSAQASQAIQRAQDAFQRAGQPPRWPMYVRQVKQYLRAADEGFDERKYGFATIVEFLRACQREGVFRLERDRQGVLRVFPGANVQRPIAQIGTVTEPAEASDTPGLPLGDPAPDQTESAPSAPVHDGQSLDAPATPGVTDGITVEGETEPATERDPASPEDAPRARAPRSRRSVKKATTGRPAARKSTGARAATPRAPRARKG
jgi:uncharacterized LabA/DUF88 family protein